MQGPVQRHAVHRRSARGRKVAAEWGVSVGLSTSKPPITRLRSSALPVSQQPLTTARMPAGPPLVSVVIPCFNAGRMLRAALASVLAQRHPNLEIIFVDNNSTDGSLEIAREVAAASARPFTVTSCPAQGVNHARNHGYGLVRGDYVQWMDADDRLDPDKIALQAAALAREPAADIAYGDWTAHDWTAQGLVALQPPVPTPHALAQVDDQLLRTLAGVWYPPPLYLIRRAAADRLQAAAGWWPGRPVATDIEYSAVAALLGLKFRHVPGARMHYNIWSDSQISGGTAYSARVAALAAIFARLRELAGSADCRVRLSRPQRRLLDQDWGIWGLPPGSAALRQVAGRRFAFSRQGGPAIELRPREAAVARALLSDARRMTSCHRALLMAEAIPELRGDHAFIVETLEGFQRAGILVA